MTCDRAARLAASLLFLFAPAASPAPDPASADMATAAAEFGRSVRSLPAFRSGPY